MKTSLRLAVKTFYDNQKRKNQIGNRLKIKKNGEDQIIPENQQETWSMTERDKEFFLSMYEFFEHQEKVIFKWIKEELKKYPIWTEYLKGVKGVGETLAAVIISEYDIHIADTVSKLWSFTGLAHGRDRLVKGEKACFNKGLRSKMCGVLGMSFLMCGSPYKGIYDDTKMRLENSDKIIEGTNIKWKDTTPLHRHRAAVRKMIKEFLKDLYIAWRTLEGLTVREPYQEEYLGKRHNKPIKKSKPCKTSEL